MNLRRILGVIASACLVGTASGADKDLSLSYRPLFLSVAQPQLFAPYLVQIENKGPNTKGTFTVSSGMSRVRYPIDLPQNTTKQITIYMPNTYDSVRGRLTTDIGNAELRFPETGNVSNCLLSIGDTDGLLNFTRAVESQRSAMAGSFSPMSAKPKDLPERTACYLSFSGIFLADGAEKIGQRARFALERYVISGGTLIVSGGASSPLLNDPAWRPMLPVFNVRPETQSVDATEVVSGLQIEGDFTMSVGTLAPDAIVKAKYRSKPFVVSKPYGFGRVVFIAANLFENPVSKWEGKTDFIGSLALQDSSTRMAGIQAMAMMDPTAGPMSYRYSGMAPPPGYPVQEDGGPFSASVPPTSTVVWILIAYFILVVPINLLYLKKKGRGELAWITAPILSLGFAAIFFRFAAGLYTAELSTASTGFLIAEQNTNQAYFLGGSQMFFPRGGRYDLKLESVEGIRSREGDPYGMYGRGRQDPAADFDPIDLGSQVVVPDLSVSNLSFKEFGYFQAAKGDWLAVSPAGSKTVSVTNRSGHPIRNANLFFQGGIADIGELKAGETRAIKLEQTGSPRSEYYSEMGMGLDQMIANQTKQSRIAITGELEGYRPGPQVGKLVERNTRLRLIWFGSQEGRS